MMTSHQGHARGRRLGPVRVLQILPGLGVGGGQSNLLRQLRHVDPTRVRHQIVSLSYRDEHTEAFEAAGCRVDVVPYRGVRDLVPVTARLVRTIRRDHIDVVQTNTRRDRLPGHLAALISKRPVVTVLRSNDAARHYRPPGADESRRSLIRRRVELLLERRVVAHVSAVSHDVLDQWEEAPDTPALPPGGTSVVYPSVEPGQASFTDDTERLANLRRELSIPDGAPVLLNVALAVPHKRQLSLLPYMERILSRRPGVHLLVAGDGPLMPKLTEAVRERRLEGSVHLLGMRTDVPRLLALCDVFVFPSRREPFGNAPLEALAAGRPVVAFAPSALSEMVEDGRSGILVPEGDVEALADATLELLEDPSQARAMGDFAREDVAVRFDARRIADEMTAVYESVARS